MRGTPDTVNLNLLGDPGLIQHENTNSEFEYECGFGTLPKEGSWEHYVGRYNIIT